MRNYRFIGVVLLGSITIYILMETFEFIEPRQYHIEQGNYPVNINLGLNNPTASGTASIYPGPVKFINGTNS